MNQPDCTPYISREVPPMPFHPKLQHACVAKLQRLRDMVRAWAEDTAEGNKDILLEARKSIEIQMVGCLLMSTGLADAADAAADVPMPWS